MFRDHAVTNVSFEKMLTITDEPTADLWNENSPSNNNPLDLDEVMLPITQQRKNEKQRNQIEI